MPTDTWFRRTDGPGVAFGHEEHLGSYNILMTPVAIGGFFVGDYEGLVAQPPTHAPDPQDIFASTVGGQEGQN